MDLVKNWKVFLIFHTASSSITPDSVYLFKGNNGNIRTILWSHFKVNNKDIKISLIVCYILAEKSTGSCCVPYEDIVCFTYSCIWTNAWRLYIRLKTFFSVFIVDPEDLFTRKIANSNFFVVMVKLLLILKYRVIFNPPCNLGQGKGIFPFSYPERECFVRFWWNFALIH